MKSTVFYHSTYFQTWPKPKSSTVFEISAFLVSLRRKFNPQNQVAATIVPGSFNAKMRKTRSLKMNNLTHPIYSLFIFVNIGGKTLLSHYHLRHMHQSPGVRGHSTVISYSFHYRGCISGPIRSFITGKHSAMRLIMHVCNKPVYSCQTLWPWRQNTHKCRNSLDASISINGACSTPPCKWR